jgi:glycine reductase
MAVKVVHYINQFFAGIGGEEKADHPAELRQGHVGPGMALQKAFGDEAEIVATVVCGDSYFNENLETSKAEVLEMIKSQNPDVLIAGPAFNAGRYGVACGTVAQMVQEELNIPVVTAMYEENPGADMFRKEVYIQPTANSAAGMRKAVKPLAAFALKLAKGEEILSPEEDGYFARGARVNYFTDKIGGERAVDMLVAKLTGAEFTTEYPMPTFDNVEPGKAIKDMSKAKIAVVTSGGIVPAGNPDRIESSSASKYGQYKLNDMGETAHGGYDPVYANERPNRVMGIDVLQDMVAEGLIGSLHEFYYTTTGNGTSVKNSDAFGTEIGQKLLADGVDAVILTST